MAEQSESRSDGEILTKEHIERLRPIFIEAMTDSEGEYPEQIEIIVDMALKWMAHCENAPRSEQGRNEVLDEAIAAIPDPLGFDVEFVRNRLRALKRPAERLDETKGEKHG